MGAGYANSFEMRLQNIEGIPVLCLGGEITSITLEAVKSALRRLSNAGHYNIVLNMEHANVSNWQSLCGLSDVVDSIRSHYGAVELVVSKEAVNQLLGMDYLARLFKVCNSEPQAVSLIKKLVRQPDSLKIINARILE